MALNKQRGNMYGFVTHTWNPIRGKCPHECTYCYMKGRSVGELRLEEKELTTNLGEGNFIFVGSSTDMWAAEVPYQWIEGVLLYCKEFNNEYLLQTKRTTRYIHFDHIIRYNNFMLATTIETNRHMKCSEAPNIYKRVSGMHYFRRTYTTNKLMVTIEPIMDFDFESMMDIMATIAPDIITVGADSKGHNLPEPPAEKILELIEELKAVTEVKLKPNLKRLLGSQWPE